MQTSARSAVVACSLLLAASPAIAQEEQEAAPLTAEESTMLGNALMFDPATLSSQADKPLRVPNADAKGWDVTHTRKPDGSTTVVVKQPLHTDWSNSVGADMPAQNTAPGAEIDPFPGTRSGTGTGTAWASLGVPYVGSVDARVDPTNEQGKIGTTLKQSIPVGTRFAVTVQDTYSVTDTVGRPAAGPSDLPLMALPATGPAPMPQVYDNEKAVKFNILPTGTTLGAGVTTASNDPTTHNSFSADQKLYGPLHVTTAVTDLGQATSNKSITAGFKLNW
ncbi:MAG TPA: hypothetical protein VJR71_13865 [Pseudolabrys sp.]|nr:hypothetical protein [Pseudolabrys sp.]